MKNKHSKKNNLDSLDSNYKIENQVFFQKAPLTWLQNLAEVKGLTSNLDLELIFPYIAEHFNKLSASIFEVGFGYGRVLKWIRQKSALKKIVAIDHSNQFFQEQQREFEQDKNITFANESVIHFTLYQPIDVALWMWAGIFELNDFDKAQTILKISSSLEKGGKVVIEIPDEIVGHDSVDYINENYLQVKTEFGKLNVFRASTDQLEKMATNANLKLIQNIAYLTTSKIKRRILIFEKK